MALRSSQPPTQWVSGVLWLFPHGVKWLQNEADHSPAPSAKHMHECNYTSTPLICLYGMHSNFTLRTRFTFFFPQHTKCNQSVSTTWPPSFFHHHSCQKSHFASSHTPGNVLVILIPGKYFPSHHASMAAQC